MSKITSCLWFYGNAQAAANFYVSVFKGAGRKNSKVGKISHYGEAAAQASGQKKSSVMTVDFTLDGREFMGLNEGPIFKFTEAVSFIIYCKTQKEIDYFWKKLTSGGGKESYCGWLKDKYGLSWQITPVIMQKIAMSDKNRKKSEAVMQAMMTMRKLDIKKLEAAYAGK